jgi:imidazolonepropionase-like amidohydrolase
VDETLMEFHPEWLDDPLLRRVVPAAELATARDPESGVRLRTAEVGMAVPWLPVFLRRPVARLVLTEDDAVGRLASPQAAVRAMPLAGVPIVLGSDASNWAIVPYQFDGPTTLREVELLVGAGLSPAEALAAGTRVAAEMLGLDAEIGTVEV